VYLLADAAVLMKAVLGLLALPELNAQCDVEDLWWAGRANDRRLAQNGKIAHNILPALIRKSWPRRSYHQVLEGLLPGAVAPGSDDSAELLEGLISLVGRDSKQF
jgi:hypothetical protein